METPISGFNASVVGAGLRTAMQFGTPVDPARRPAFILAASASDPGEDAVDGFGVPFDPTAPAPAAPVEVTGILCAYEAAGAQSDTNRGGLEVQEAVLVVTLLEEEWLQVKDCIAVRLGDSTYIRKSDGDHPEYALGTLGVHQISFQAGDVQ